MTEDIFAGMLAEIHSTDWLELDKPAWAAAKVGDHVVVLRDWALGVSAGAAEAGVAMVTKVDDSPTSARLRVRGPGFAGELWAANTHVVEIIS